MLRVLINNVFGRLFTKCVIDGTVPSLTFRIIVRKNAAATSTKGEIREIMFYKQKIVAFLSFLLHRCMQPMFEAGDSVLSAVYSLSAAARVWWVF